MLIDGYLPHYDVVERHRIVVNASREDTFRAMRALDFARALDRAAAAVLDTRSLPRLIRDVVHRVRHLPPDTTFTIEDALRNGFVLLADRPRRAIAIGAIGKLWKPYVALLPLTRAEFHAFHDPKYAKVAVAFWVEPVGRGKSAVRCEARAAATDDSARTHLRRWDRVVRPYRELLMRRALEDVKAEAETRARPAFV